MTPSIPVPAHGVRDLRLKVIRHLEELVQEALDNDKVQLGLAARISDALLSMIEVMPDLGPHGQDAVRGAIDYFVLNRDELPDLESASGFVDDAQVVNRTCEEIALPELKIRIG
ncbi:MAG: hypothetical protein ACR2F6_02630 [Mycobacteriales bacterium]